jgi:hypothetical protein
MAIDALYREYFQKSKIFLYPLLEIKKGSCAVPEQTFVSWDSHIKSEDTKLVTVYPNRTDLLYKNFEKNILLKHPRICDYVQLNDEQILITFDFADLSEDWDHFINGKYSMIDIKTKRKILNFFDKTSGNYVYMESYLFPEKYFNLYANLLNTSEDFLKSVGELCSKPDLEKENLVAEVINLENKKILG